MAKVFQRRKGWGDNPILIMEKGEVFTYPKGWGDKPIITIEGSEIYEGRKSWGTIRSPLLKIMKS